jgi:hypothetical protein
LIGLHFIGDASGETWGDIDRRCFKDIFCLCCGEGVFVVNLCAAGMEGGGAAGFLFQADIIFNVNMHPRAREAYASISQSVEIPLNTRKETTSPKSDEIIRFFLKFLSASRLFDAFTTSHLFQESTFSFFR